MSDVTGVQVARGRSDTRDYYHFKLRCGKLWRESSAYPLSACARRDRRRARGTRM